LTDFLASSIRRNFTVRHDYGLYEYCVYVYRDAVGSGIEPSGTDILQAPPP
jgi:hypothetical protein